MFARAMMQRGRIWGALCLLGTALLCPAVASAQDAGAAPAGPSGPGNGIKVGNGRLHPFISLETRLDSGVGYFPPVDNPGEAGLPSDLSGEVLLHIRPGLKLDVPSSKVAFNLSGSVDYVVFTGLLTPTSTAASRLEAEADVSARINEGAPVSVVLSDQFARSDRTRNAAVGAGVLSLFNELRASVPVRPGGGAIEITPEAAWAVEFFQSVGALTPVGCTEGACNPVAIETFDYNNLRAGVDGRWRFLPKTALVVDTDFDVRSYFKGTNPNAQLLRAMAGLAGLVSPKVAVTAKVGWGQNFGETGGGTLIAHLEGSYMMSPTMTFKGGYLRTLEPVSAYGLFRDDRGYVEGRALFGGKLALHGSLAVDSLSFLGSTAARRDTLFSMDLGPEYPLRPWLVGSAGYLLNTRSSSLEGAGLNYSRHELYVRVTATY
ncbi:hypothetical protein P2318_08535 [Myxococcaceae bacterium GXIMD 01537]